MNFRSLNLTLTTKTGNLAAPRFSAFFSPPWRLAPLAVTHRVRGVLVAVCVQSPVESFFTRLRGCSNYNFVLRLCRSNGKSKFAILGAKKMKKGLPVSLAVLAR